MSSSRDEAAAAGAAAPVWNPPANSPSPPRFRPKLKSSLPRVLLQDNRSLSNGLERKLTGLLRARARAESYWESNKRKLVAAQRLRLDDRRCSLTQPVPSRPPTIAALDSSRSPDSDPVVQPRQLRGGERVPRTRVGERTPPTASGAPLSPKADGTAAGPLTTFELPLVRGATNASRRIYADPVSPQPPPLQQQQQHGGEPWLEDDLPQQQQQQQLLLRRASLDSGNNRSPPFAGFSRSVSLAPVAPGRLQYDIQHQIEEEDRFVAFLTFKSKPRASHAGRLHLGI